MKIRFVLMAGLAACVAAGLLFPWARTTIVAIVCYGLAGLGLVTLMRAGQVSFGHAMYACISGYVVAYLARAFPGLDGLWLIAAGTLASLLAGAIFGAFLMRYRSIFFGMLNLGISMVLVSVLGKLYTYTGGTDGLRFERPTLFGMTLERAQFELAMMLLALVVALALGWLAQRFFASAAGQVMVASKTNETRLEYLGISATRALWEGYVVSAGLVGIAGAMLVMVQGLVTPESGYWLRSGEYVFIAILGGAGHALGAFLGAAAFEVIKLVAASYLTGAWQILLGLTLLAVIYYAPGGIVGQFGRTLQGASGERAWKR